MWTHDGNFVEIYFSVEPPKVAKMAENGPENSSAIYVVRASINSIVTTTLYENLSSRQSRLA
jgi:hypothetical protein